jgi:hypothetical protein
MVGVEGGAAAWEGNAGRTKEATGRESGSPDARGSRRVSTRHLGSMRTRARVRDKLIVETTDCPKR